MMGLGNNQPSGHPKSQSLQPGALPLPAKAGPPGAGVG